MLMRIYLFDYLNQLKKLFKWNQIISSIVKIRSCDKQNILKFYNLKEWISIWWKDKIYIYQIIYEKFL